MKNDDCVHFLQWALPTLRMRWPGFRKVRKQVCRRIGNRLKQLALADVATYQDYLQQYPEEWQVLDGMCRISISRFFRDKMVFAVLEQEIVPMLASEALDRGEECLRIWSAGCCAGEEPYTLAILWALKLSQKLPGLSMHILATDVDDKLLALARQGCYQYSSVKNLPQILRERAFNQQNNRYCLASKYKEKVELYLHDIRSPIPYGPFHLILCRNLAFTYFENALQLKVASHMWDKLVPGGVLVLGVHEKLPEGCEGFQVLSRRFSVYKKIKL